MSDLDTLIDHFGIEVFCPADKIALADALVQSGIANATQGEALKRVFAQQRQDKFQAQQAEFRERESLICGLPRRQRRKATWWTTHYLREQAQSETKERKGASRRDRTA